VGDLNEPNLPQFWNGGVPTRPARVQNWVVVGGGFARPTPRTGAAGSAFMPLSSCEREEFRARVPAGLFSAALAHRQHRRISPRSARDGCGDVAIRALMAAAEPLPLWAAVGIQH
jgi:hypothetical protein